MAALSRSKAPPQRHEEVKAAMNYGCPGPQSSSSLGGGVALGLLGCSGSREWSAASSVDRPLAAGGIGAPLFIAMRASDPLQDLLYFVRYPWPWGKPHEAAGIHRPCRWRGGDVAARGTRAAASDAGDRVPRGRHAGYLRELCGWVSPGPGRG